MDRNYYVTTCQNILILKRPGEAILADIINKVIMFNKTNIKDSRKVKTTTNYVSKPNLYLYFLM